MLTKKPYLPPTLSERDRALFEALEQAICIKNKSTTEIKDNLKLLRTIIETANVPITSRFTQEWGGADVIITSKNDERIERFLSNQPLVISPQKSEPRRRAVVTKHAKKLSWLIVQLQKIFNGHINWISKYDFYGALAQAALDTQAIQGDQIDYVDMLLSVVDAAETFCNTELEVLNEY